jgi:hypothetical protein
MSNHTDRQGAARLEALLAIALGVGAFLLFIGPRVLLPGNIAWLAEGDPAQHYLGWLFFRNTPWTFPLGLNPSLGLELSNGIAYTDSIPGLALFFKALSPVLPPVFQYFGVWLLACFVLQAWFGWKLAGLVTESALPRLLIAALFVSAPPMLFRTTYHLALSGHFLVLAALYLVLRPDRRYQALFWLLLLVAAALTNAYLLLMTGACWVADVVGVALSRRETWKALVLQVPATLGAVGLALWQAGFFAESDTGAEGFGIYRLNLLSLVDPNGWSHVLPDLPGGPGDYEGFNFLGLGLLILAVVALVVLARRRAGLGRHISRRPVFVLALASFALFAVSGHIGVGSLDLTAPLPESLVALASMFRASGRVFWPVFYVIVLAIAYLAVRGTDRRIATALLALAVTVQIADTSISWRTTRDRMMTLPAATWETPLTSPFWAAAGARYSELRRIIPQNIPPGWDTLGYFAATHGMATDIVYFPRIGAQRLEEAQRTASKAAEAGRYRPEALYIVHPDYVRLVAEALDPTADVLAEVDGQYVVAPGWATCGECPPVGRPIRLAEATPPPLGVPIRFGSGEASEGYLGKGWSSPEPWGAWSLGPRAELLFPAPGTVQSIALDVIVFVQGKPATQRVVVFLNGIESHRTELATETARIDITVSEDVRRRIAEDGRLDVRLDLPDASSPQAAGLSPDARLLALGLVAVTLH